MIRGSVVLINNGDCAKVIANVDVGNQTKNMIVKKRRLCISNSKEV